MKMVPFAKYSGCGNDFILIDHRHPFWPWEKKDLITTLCERRLGIGADGIILLENSQYADFKMRIFNADGSEAEMCGNGIRCLFKFIRQLGHQAEKFTIESLAGIHSLSLEGDLVSVNMGIPTEEKLQLSVACQGQNIVLNYVNTGVPHAVIFVDDLEDERLMQMAPSLRYHKQFQPRGTNVNFVQIKQNNEVHVRTYERGVEGETLACGTGATAVGYLVHKIYKIPFPVKIRTRSGDFLKISVDSHAIMSGPARHIFQGTFNLQEWITF